MDFAAAKQCDCPDKIRLVRSGTTSRSEKNCAVYRSARRAGLKSSSRRRVPPSSQTKKSAALGHWCAGDFAPGSIRVVAGALISTAALGTTCKMPRSQARKQRQRRARLQPDRKRPGNRKDLARIRLGTAPAAALPQPRAPATWEPGLIPVSFSSPLTGARQASVLIIPEHRRRRSIVQTEETLLQSYGHCEDTIALMRGRQPSTGPCSTGADREEQG